MLRGSLQYHNYHCSAHYQTGTSHYILHRGMSIVRNGDMEILVGTGTWDVVGNEIEDKEAKKAATDKSSSLRKLPARLRRISHGASQ
jgi:hypothetical protein